MNTKQVLISLLMTIITGSSIHAYASQAVSPLWLRDVQVSPDGSQILFCYKGDCTKSLPKAVQLSS